MRRKISIAKLALPLASICLMIWTFSVLSRPAFQDIPLTDTQADSHGWGGYEIRTGPEEAVSVTPRYTGEGYELSGERYDAVRRSRIMAEEEFYRKEAKLRLDYAGRGIELFLDGQLFYSDFSVSLRDSNGFLVLDEDDFAAINSFDFKSITLGLPVDFMGKTLTMTVYYPYADTWGVVVPPVMSSIVTIPAAGVTGTVAPMLWQVFWGVVMVLMAVSCAGSVTAVSGRSLRAKYILLFITYVAFFLVNAYNSNMGFYSGFSDWINRVVPHALFNMWPWIMLLCALILMGLELWEHRRGKKKLLGRFALFGLIGFWIDAIKNTTELGNRIWDYLPVILENLSWGNWRPAVKMASAVVIYIITMQAIVQFISRRIEEWKDRSRLLERSRFARENYEMIMQVDEDSRRRKHEMKHHLQTIRSLLSAREAEKAGEYIEKLIQETDRFAETTYSENIVVNAIVGIRLNQAKGKGIAVRSHIHVPDRLEMDDADLNSLLSNLLENAIEACMRMEDRTGAYINLEIRKNQRFLFIECENSVDPGESLKPGQTTVKDGPNEHGFGLKVMNAVAEKYASIMQIEREPGRFVARTNLCLPE